MQDAYFCSNVSGMTCRPCEDTILETVLATQGVIRASVSYWNAEVKITYDPDIVSEQRLREILTQIGYPPCEKAYAGLFTELLTAAAVLLTVWLLPRLPMPAIPQAEAGASLRMSKHIPFIVGVLNGLLPCAASGAMWLYAASSGSLLRGAVSMLVWCLGTLPLMSVFTLAGRVLPQKGLRFFERISVILMLAMGMRMTWQGLCILL